MTETRLPLPSETCCITEYELLKRDALLFDRVYVTEDLRQRDGIPEDVAFNIPEAESSGWSDIPTYFLPPFNHHSYGEMGSFHLDLDHLVHTRGIPVVLSYSKFPTFYHDFRPGVQIAYDAALNNLPVVDPARVTWDEIVEFRNDPDAKRKYRDLKLWLHHALQAESIQHATDLIAQRIDDYAWAIRKHGLQTRIGALTQIFDYKQGATTAVVSGAAALLAGPVAAAIAGGFMVGAQAAAWLAERRLDLRDAIRGPNREVAILYDAQLRFGTR